MTAINLDRIALQASIGLIRMGVIPGVIAISLLFGVASWAWLAINMRDQALQEHTLAQVRQGLSVPLAAANVVDRGAAGEQNNLHKFYDALGDRSETEQSLKTLFDIAEQAGLNLDEGEYKWQLDKNSNIYRYQILLPVKGPYAAIRQFCEQALLALPFASLDEWSFKRESIGDDALDVSLRFTLYLKDVLRAPQPTGTVK